MNQRHSGKNFRQKLLRFNDWFLVLILTIFTLLRLPSLIEPHWYGDEGIYETIGKALMHGRVLYLGIWDNKPPLLYLLYAGFNGDQFWVRFCSLLVGLASVIAFYFLSKKIFKRQVAQYISTALFTLGFALPLLEGNIANAENFILLPIILVWYGIYSKFPSNKSLWWFFSFGFLMAVAALTKVVAVFDLASMGTFMVFLVTKEKITAVFSYLLIWITMAVGFAVPMLITASYFLAHHAFISFFTATFSQNISYVGVNNYFLFPLGLIVIKTVILMLGLVVLWRIRSLISQQQLMIMTWFLWGVFSAFFSERPYTHYLLMLLPSLSLFIGLFWENIRYRAQLSLVLVVVVLLVYFNFPFYLKVIGYYQNYISYIWGSESADAYQSFFDSRIPDYYALANFVRDNTTANEGVFFWTDSGQLYALSDKLPPGKYIVAYHITFYPDGFSNTKNALKRNPPKFIISTRDDLPGSYIKNYVLKYHYADASIYERTD